MLLQANNITKTYSLKGQASTSVLRGVSLSCDTAEFVALMGPSGAGKSTLIHILASLDEPDAGVVELQIGSRTIRYSELSNKQLAAVRNEHIGIVYQFHHLLPEFTAIENVMLPLLIGGVGSSEARNRALEMLDRVGVGSQSKQLPKELSGGEQQRVAIARALINKPAIVFADEPTGNLDTVNANAVVRLLTDLQKEFGMACIVATHSNELAAMAHRIVRLQDGVVTAQQLVG